MQKPIPKLCKCGHNEHHHHFIYNECWGIELKNLGHGFEDRKCACTKYVEMDNLDYILWVSNAKEIRPA